MKAYLSTTFFLFFSLIFILPSCKKGENDPFISLQTRKARLCGEWKVSREEGQIFSTYDNHYINYCDTSIYSFDGTTKLGTSVGKQTVTYPTSIDELPYNKSINEQYSEKYIFKRNGTFDYEYINADDASQKNYSGTWKFLPKDKGTDAKNKERIILQFTTCLIIDANGYYSQIFPLNFSTNKIVFIDKLRSKEIILFYENQWTNSDGFNTTSTNEYIYTILKSK